MLARAMISMVLLSACSGDATTDKTDETDPTDTTTATDTAPTDETDTTVTDDATTGDTGTEVTVAKSDNDTVDKPLFENSFLGSGAPDTFTANDDISAAPGDTEDWVGFTTPAPQNPMVTMTLELTCTGSDNAGVQIWDTDGSTTTPLGASFSLNCAVGTDTYQLDTSHDYAARVYYPSGSDAGDYTEWELTISF